MKTTRSELLSYYDTLLSPRLYQDYGPNGLQIEGAEEIQRIAFAVSATADSVSKAIAGGAQALVVHHGLFWKFHGPRPLTGPFARRVLPLVRAEVNLIAYHLPLDGHPEIGNAAVLGQQLGLTKQQAFGDYHGMPTGIQGQFAEPQQASQLRETLKGILNHEVLLASPDESALIRFVGIITGGANGEWKQALQQGLDAYLTGEMSEHDWHESQEAGIHFYAGGHHATERFGIQALMAKTQEAFGVACFFIDSENPA